MARKIVWTKFAKNNIKSFYLYTKMYYPKKYMKMLTLCVNNSLQNSPRLGKQYVVYNHKIIRQIIYNQHKIYYFISTNQEIAIIAVIHFKQDVNSILNPILKNF